ncbi:MAG: type IV secretory system conjugative DNA transfer family protein [Alphaproteobacteria bacterium]|nr:type IV secretory system conjugative DNA transfer family protein [Alphaproteobacteria bacterium]
MEPSESVLANIKRLSQKRTFAFSTAICACLLIILFSVAAHAQYYDFPSVRHESSPFWARLLPSLFSSIIGIIIGAFFSPALKKFRRYIGYAILAGIVLFAAFGPSPEGDAVSYLIATVLFFVAFYFGIRIGKKMGIILPAKRATSLGSAQWATLQHLQENGIIGSDGLLLGTFASNSETHPLQYEGARHLLTVAPTRSGKGVSSIIPNLLLHQGSAFIVDPKGENALVTALRRGQGSTKDNIPGMGQKVVLLDPWDVAASKLGLPQAAFNPLDWIKSDDPDAAENAFLLADALVVPENEVRERFWDDEAKALLTGIILYVGTADEESDDRTLGRVRDILNMDDTMFRDVLTKMSTHSHPVVRSTAARQASKATRLFSSVLAVAQAHTHFLDSNRIRQSLERSDFSFEELKSAPTSVYLILPADRLNTFDRWLRLLIQQAITVNARNVEKKPSKPILFLLDEMPALGRLPALEQAYSLMAGFGMQLWGIIQDLSQLARVYGEHGWQTFISNSGVIQYFGSRDKMTAEYFSTLCGVTTVETHNFSWAVGKAISYATSMTFSSSGGSSTDSTTSTSSWTRTSGVSEAQRQLAYPDELMALKRNDQIVFVENLDPIPGQKVVWYDHASLKSLGINLQALKG